MCVVFLPVLVCACVSVSVLRLAGDCAPETESHKYIPIFLPCVLQFAGCSQTIGTCSVNNSLSAGRAPTCHDFPSTDCNLCTFFLCNQPNTEVKLGVKTL